MPYEVRKSGTKWHVVKLVKRIGGQESTEVVGKHDTKEKAYAQYRALKANVEDA